MREVNKRRNRWRKRVKKKDKRGVRNRERVTKRNVNGDVK